MKKISDVFKLPCSGVDIQGDVTYYSQSESQCEIDDMIANAINHVDALADALEYLLKELRETYIHNSNLSEAESKAEDALKSYRDEK